MPENNTGAGIPPIVRVGVSKVLYMTLPSAGATDPVGTGLPFGSPFGVAVPPPVK